MLILTVALNFAVAAMCFAGISWRGYADNFGERMGMVAIALTAVGQGVFYASSEPVIDRYDVMWPIGVLLFGWGVACAKLRAHKRRKQATLTLRSE